MIWLALLAAIVLAGVLEQRAERRRAAGAYVASRWQLRQWRRDRLTFDHPNIWRRG